MKITENLLTPNKYSRPQKPLEKVTKIAVHYVGNPNTSAIILKIKRRRDGMFPRIT